MIYPDRHIVALFIENESVFEEVWAGLTPLDDALLYLRVQPGTELYELARKHLLSGEPPI